MNTLILEKKDFLNKSGNIVKLDGRRAEHILGIKKVTLGSSIKAGLLNGRLGTAIVINIDFNCVTLEVLLKDEPSPPLPLSIILALPRPKMLKRVLQTIASLGVKQLYLVNSWKVEKSYWQSPQLSKSNIREQLLLGLEQGCETFMPEVIIKQRFKPFLEDELLSIAKDTHALVAHPSKTKFFPGETKENTMLAIGPEGGFTDYELQKFIEIGFKHLSLGNRIQRVETVIPLLVGKLFY